jgi:ubiquinone/menaquinone biosynthesis C-methylase UbiE
MTDRQKSDAVFSGSVAEFYETYLVPLIFESYAEDLADRVARGRPHRVLEIAAGTGVVTRQLASRLEDDVEIVATDLNQPMLDRAALIGTARPVEWRQADALHLPFPDERFDAVVCQFGVMFFPDRIAAYREARRVLAPGGTFVFNVWDRIEENVFTHVVEAAVGEMFPDDPPRFLSRTPHGYHDREVVESELAQARFETVEITTIAGSSTAVDARHPAIAFVQGTPLLNEINARDPSRVEEATRRATSAISERFGTGPVEAKIQAHVVAARR